MTYWDFICQAFEDALDGEELRLVQEYMQTHSMRLPTLGHIFSTASSSWITLEQWRKPIPLPQAPPAATETEIVAADPPLPAILPAHAPLPAAATEITATDPPPPAILPAHALPPAATETEITAADPPPSAILPAHAHPSPAAATEITAVDPPPTAILPAHAHPSPAAAAEIAAADHPPTAILPAHAPPPAAAMEIAAAAASQPAAPASVSGREGKIATSMEDFFLSPTGKKKRSRILEGEGKGNVDKLLVVF